MRCALGLGAALLAVLALTGCAVPRWVPFLGASSRDRDARVSTVPPPAAAEPAGAVGAGAARPRAEPDEHVADRVVAVVNNDAITLGEVQESVAVYRYENRAQPVTATDEDLSRQFLTKLIDGRLQLQEAEREKIVVEDTEVAEELADRMKKFGVQNQEELEKAVRNQGLTLDTVKKRLRETIRVAKVIRRKVTLRISVTDQEIGEYLEANRAKLETGLAYHARHVLVEPETADSDAAWEAARTKAESLWDQLRAGGDFAELAKEHSRDASARDGGDLGTLKRGELAQDIEAAILSLHPGEISRPFRSPLGYHVFRLESKEVLEGDGLTRARQQIRDILFREKYDARLDAWLKEIRQRAIIEVRM